MVDDMRPPRAVVRTFAERIAPILAERGFALAGAKQRYSEVYDGPMFVRTRATAVDRVVLHAESYGSPGWVTCLVLFAIEDSAILAIAPSWERVLFLSSLREVDFPTANLARTADGDWLVYQIEAALEFFDLAANPQDLLAEASRRYVPGFEEPSLVAPLLRAYLGPEAVARYASALLRGRPELWPAFLAHRGETTLPRALENADHGSQLASMVGSHAPGAKLVRPPADTVRSPSMRAASLRASMGLQLRAWGEPTAAGLLRRVGDDQLEALYDDIRKQHIDRVDDARGARAVLRVATGEDRPCRREGPEPLYYQYERLHAPFGD